MTARILDGKAVADQLTREVREGVDARRAAGYAPPGLAVVLVGDNAASQVYVRNKRRMTEAVGMRSFAFDLPADARRERAARADRSPERRSGGQRNSRAVAAAQAHRQRARHRAHRPAQGCRRLSSVQRRTARAEDADAAALHALWLHAAARGDRRGPRRQARGGHRPVEHRRTADGARAADGALHGDDLPFGDARPAGARAAGGHRRRGRRQGRASCRATGSSRARS